MDQLVTEACFKRLSAEVEMLTENKSISIRTFTYVHKHINLYHNQWTYEKYEEHTFLFSPFSCFFNVAQLGNVSGLIWKLSPNMMDAYQVKIIAYDFGFQKEIRFRNLGQYPDFQLWISANLDQNLDFETLIKHTVDNCRIGL